MLNRIITAILPYFPKAFIWQFSKRYIAGEKLDNAIKIVKSFNKKGISTSLDLLGEFHTDFQKIELRKRQYINIIKKSIEQNLDTTFSLKPTMFGLLIDYDQCYNTIRDIVEYASNNNAFIRLDMEDSSCTKLELNLFEALYQNFPRSIGIVLQSYLKRTENDLLFLLSLNNKDYPINIRICKGIYIEEENIAYKKKDDINKHFFRDIKFLLENKIYSAIATHDEKIIEQILEFVQKNKIPKEKIEFQMLYGVRPKLCDFILNKNYKMRIYIPFGKDWFAYSIRRLKENPKLVGHILKALIIRN